MENFTEWQYNRLLLDIILFLILLPSIYYDLKENRIPNFIIQSALLFGFIIVFILGDYAQIRGHLFGLVLGFGFFYLFYLAGWMGAGDVKLFAVIGLLKGVKFLVSVFIYATFCSGLIMLIYLVYALIKKKNLKSLRLPYGTAICLGTYTVLFIQYGLQYTLKAGPEFIMK
jgi:prepilin peptidase CpaA